MGLKEDLAKAKKDLKDIISTYELLSEQDVPQAFRDVANSTEKTSKHLEEMQKLTKSIERDVSELDNVLGSVIANLNKVVDSLSGANAQLNRQKNALRSISRIGSEILNMKEGEVAASKSSIQKLQNKLSFEKLQLQLLQKQHSVNSDAYKMYENQIIQLEAVKSASEKVLKVHQKTNRQLGFAPQILGGIDKQMQKLGLPNLGVSDALEQTQKLNQAAGGTQSILKTWSTFTVAFVKNLNQALSLSTLLQFGIGQIFSIFKEIDGQTTEFAANMGVTYSEANATKEEMQNIARATGDASVRSDILMKSQMAIGKEVGTNAKLNKKDLVTMNKLVNSGKLRMESAAKLQKLSLLNGKSLQNNSKEILGAAKAQASKNGLVLNEMDIMDDVANISDLLAINLGESSTRMAEAAVNTRKFGINLAQAESMSRSLLDFESSIAAELEAELLTGKSLNMEKARSLALAGKSDQAAAEMLKQVKSSAEFAKMDVIAQDAIAKSMGMSSQELAKSLRNREALNKMGAKEGQSAQARYQEMVKSGMSHKEIAEQMQDEDMANMLQKQGIQDKFNDSMFKLKEIIANELMPVFQKIGDFLAAHPGAIFKTLKAVGALGLAFVGIKTTMKIIEGIQFAQNLLSKENIQLLRTRLFTQEGILTTLGLQDSVLAFQMAKAEGMNFLQAIREGMEQNILGKLILQGGKIVYNIGKAILMNVQKAAEVAANYSIVASQNTQLGGFVKLIARGAAYLATLLAQAAAAMAANAAITFGIGVAIAVAAAAAGYAAVKAMTANDMVSPGKKKQGYGERTLFGPEGAIQLNDKDTVIAGTNLFGNDTVSEPGKATERKGKGEIKVKSEGADMSAVIEAINSLAGRPISVQIDGREIAIATEDGNPRAMGDNRRNNSYQVS
jgi:ribosomal protein S9